MRARITLVIAIGAVCWVGQPGQAYSLLGRRWNAPEVVMHLQQSSSSGNLIDGSTSWNDVTEGALATWNQFLNGISFRSIRNSNESISAPNGVNNVAFADDIYGEPFGDAIGVTVSYTRAGSTSEADVLFDRGERWNSYRGNLANAAGGGVLYDLRRVALHEFGHVLGLGHPDQSGQSVAAIMNSRVSNIDALQNDDINGVRAIYGSAAPAPPPPVDVLSSGGRLSREQSLVSTNRRYRLLYQGDGNLVLYDEAERRPLWASNTGGGAGFATMQSDGNFVVYDPQGAPRFATGTQGNPNARLLLQNDGNLVVYGANGVPVWARSQ